MTIERLFCGLMRQYGCTKKEEYNEIGTDGYTKTTIQH